MSLDRQVLKWYVKMEDFFVIKGLQRIISHTILSVIISLHPSCHRFKLPSGWTGTLYKTNKQSVTNKWINMCFRLCANGHWLLSFSLFHSLSLSALLDSDIHGCVLLNTSRRVSTALFYCSYNQKHCCSLYLHVCMLVWLCVCLCVCY